MIVVAVSLGEHTVNFEVTFQVQQEEAKLLPFNKVRTQFVLARDRVFGRLVRPHNRRLRLEQPITLQHVAHALVDLREAKIAVAIGIEGSEHFHSFLAVGSLRRSEETVLLRVYRVFRGV